MKDCKCTRTQTSYKNDTLSSYKALIKSMRTVTSSEHRCIQIPLAFLFPLRVCVVNVLYSVMSSFVHVFVLDCARFVLFFILTIFVIYSIFVTIFITTTTTP